MSDDAEYRCFIGNLSWSTSDRSLKDAFKKFGHLLDAKVVIDKSSDRSRGFGFVTFDDKAAMEEAIEEMNGVDLDGRSITVDKARPNQGSGRDFDDDRGQRDRGRDRGRDREYGGGRGSGGSECYRCGKPGHFARECPNGDGARGGGRYGGRAGTLVVGMTGTLVVAVVEAVLDMDLIEMEIVLVVAAGIAVVMGVKGTVVIVLALMIVEMGRDFNPGEGAGTYCQVNG